MLSPRSPRGGLATSPASPTPPGSLKLLLKTATEQLESALASVDEIEVAKKVEKATSGVRKLDGNFTVALIFSDGGSAVFDEDIDGKIVLKRTKEVNTEDRQGILRLEEETINIKDEIISAVTIAKYRRSEHGTLKTSLTWYRDRSIRN